MSDSPPETDPYTPQYTDIDEVPTRGPRKNSAGEWLFDPETRRRAVRRGERRLELDCNAGKVILPSHPVFGDASAEWATYLLLSSALHPAGAPLELGGDASAQRQNLAELCREDYENYVSDILNHGLTDTTDPDDPEPPEPLGLRIDRI